MLEEHSLDQPNDVSTVASVYARFAFLNSILAYKCMSRILLIEMNRLTRTEIH